MTETRPTDTRTEADAVETGWTVITRNDSVVEIIDTLLDLPPHREFNKTELADVGSVSRKSVHNHIGLLIALGILDEVPDTSPQRYRFDPESEVASALVALDGAVNNAGPYAGE